MDKILSALSGSVCHERTDEELAELAALHDDLLPTQRNSVATFLLDHLEKSLTSGHPLDDCSINILALADPYLVRSDYRAEAQMVLTGAFDAHAWKARNFNDLISIGNALAELSFNAPGARELWESFYQHFANNERYCDDALAVSMAGLSCVSVEAFAATANSVPYRDAIADAWEIYLPILIRENGRDAVQDALNIFLGRAPYQRARELRAVAATKGMRSGQPRPALQLVADIQRRIPTELHLAHELYEAERRHSKDIRGEPPLVTDQILRVIHSNYTDNDLIAKFQLAVRDIVCDLDGSDRVKYQDTATFAELPADGTLQQKLIYAFPMYLTSNKRRHGYAVFQYGLQRRIGALFFRNTALLPPTGENTLASLLRVIKRNHDSRLYCLQNFAMAELAHQCLALQPELANEFDKSAIRTVNPSLGSKRQYVPLEVGAENPTRSVFIFDLAGLDAVTAQIKHSRAKQHRNRFQAAQIITLEHDLVVPVGIGLNRYASEWAIENERWEALRALATDWAANTEFCQAMGKLGVDVEPRGGATADEHKQTLKPARAR